MTFSHLLGKSLMPFVQNSAERLRGKEVGDCRFEVAIVDEGFSSQEVLQGPEQVVVRWRKVRRIRRMGNRLPAEFH